MTPKMNKLLLVLVDFLTINIAWLVYYTIRFQAEPFELIAQIEFYIPMLIVYCYWLLIFMFIGMYQFWFALSRFDELSSLLKASIIGVLFLFSLIYYDDFSHGIESQNRFYIFIYWVIIFTYVSIGRVTLRSFQRRLLIKGIGSRNTVIVGFNKKSHEIADQIEKYKGLGLRLIGFIAVKTENIGKEYKNFKVLGGVDEIQNIIKENRIQEVIIVLGEHYEEVIIDIISKCQDTDVRLKIVPDLYNIIVGHARSTQLYGVPLVDINPRLMAEWEKKVKRLIDLVGSLVVLVLTSPILLLVSIIIKIDSKGPVMFKQERMGKDGRLFYIYKFRSMIHDAEKHTGPVWSQKDDPRITKVGKYLRKFRLDEIPQMINVLKGEMSIVGPRPERPFFVEKLSKEIPYYKRRLKVKPGITGWAQIKHKYDETIEDVKEKLKYDLFYIENISLNMDLKIMFRTVFVMIFGKGHYD